MALIRSASVFVNGECLWIDDIKAHSHIVALQDTIVDALVSRMEDTGETLCAPLRRRMSNVYPDIETSYRAY